MATWEWTSIPDGVDFEQTYPRTYEWEYGGERYTWEMELPADLYRIHARRHRIYEYGTYVADDLTQLCFDSFCDTVRTRSVESGFSPHETITFVTRFVQSLPYTPDSVSTDYSNYPRYPTETLVDETGDCEDASLLLAALLHGLGYDVGLLELESHLAVGVAVGGIDGNVELAGSEYSFIEATGVGWDVGEVPPEYENEQVRLHRIDGSPALYCDWSGSTNGNRLHCGGAVTNMGDGTARNVEFVLTLTDRRGEVVGGVRQDWNRIHPDEQVQWDAEVPVEPNTVVEPEWALVVEDQVHDRGTEAEQRV